MTIEYGYESRGMGNEIPCDYDCELNEDGICFYRDPVNTDNSRCEYRRAIDAVFPGSVTVRVTRLENKRPYLFKKLKSMRKKRAAMWAFYCLTHDVCMPFNSPRQD